MIDRIKKIISNNIEVSEWKIIEKKIKSYELFFIKRELDMNRAKNVNHYDLTVYKNFEIDGEKYKGSSQTKLHPTMTDVEIKESIDNAIYAAQFAKNKYYPLVEPTHENEKKLKSNLKNKKLVEFLPDIIDAIFKADVYEKGWINSTEMFLNEINSRIVNSCGIDLGYKKFEGAIEFITTWKEEKEEVELYRLINFANFNAKKITKEVEDMLQTCKGRALAKPIPQLNNYSVILTGTPVKDIFNYYSNRGNVAYVYQGYSTAKVNSSMQGEDIQGDKINIKLNPFLEGSTMSEPFDNEGIILKETQLIKDGVLNNYWGNNKYSYYLSVEPTGNINNIEVNCGSKSIDVMKKNAYLEIVSFSNFQMDIFTGDFGGEIRLAWYNDGNDVIPVTSGALSGNIKDYQQNMYFSKEVTQDNNYKGPKSIQLLNVNIAGN